MKTIIAAIALTIALPAAANAQAAQQGDHSQHQGNHGQHKDMDHQKDHKDCCKHKNADGSAMDCCKEKNGKLPECCKGHDQKGHDAHSGMKH